MPPSQSSLSQRIVAEARLLRKAIGARNAAIVISVAAVAGAIVLLIERYLGSGDWQWANAFADLVKLLATTIVIVGLLEWDRLRRWQWGERADLRSLAMTGQLIASGWSSPKNVGSPDLDPAAVSDALEQAAAKWESLSTEFDNLHSALLGQIGLEGFVRLQSARWSLEGYEGEGSRARRIEYLTDFVEAQLPRLVERRNDPELFGMSIALRDAVVKVSAAAYHADVVIRQKILLARPRVLASFLDDRTALSLIDPVALLAGAIECSTTAIERQGGPLDSSLQQLVFAERCVGAMRNELQHVGDALRAMDGIVAALKDEIRDALGTPGSESK